MAEAYPGESNTSSPDNKMAKPKNLLFVCTFNQMRSRTAEELYRRDERFQVKSAGIDHSAPVQVDTEILVWADIIAVMEERHMQWIRHYYANVIEKKRMICLQIPDAFYFMDEELVDLLREKFEELYEG